MAQRLLSALILAVLAVAWPAAADGGGSTDPAGPGSDGSEPQPQDANATASGSNETASNETAQEPEPEPSDSSAIEIRGLPVGPAQTGFATAVTPARPEISFQSPQPPPTPQCGSYIDINPPNENSSTSEVLTQTIVIDDEGCLGSTIRDVLERLPPPRVVIGLVAMFL